MYCGFATDDLELRHPDRLPVHDEKHARAPGGNYIRWPRMSRDYDVGGLP